VQLIRVRSSDDGRRRPHSATADWNNLDAGREHTAALAAGGQRLARRAPAAARLRLPHRSAAVDEAGRGGAGAEGAARQDLLDAEPTEAELEAYCTQTLGQLLAEHPALAGLAREGLLAPVPAGWTSHWDAAQQVIPHHETFSATIQPPYSSTKG
jgi:hypothetical protein